MREKIKSASYITDSWILSVLLHRLSGGSPVILFVLPLALLLAVLSAKKMQQYSIRGRIYVALVGMVTLLVAGFAQWGALWMNAGYGFSVIAVGSLAYVLFYWLQSVVEKIEDGTTFSRLIHDFAMSPRAIFIAFAAVVGITLVIITPVFVVNDESSHYFRAEQLANGQLISSHDNKIGFGGTTQLVSLELERYVTNRYLSDKKGEISRYITDTHAARQTSINNHKDMVFAGYNNTALYSPIPYLVSIVSIWLSKLGENSIFATIIFGRLANLVAYVVLVAMAISIVPSKKWLLAMVALLPMSLQQAASFSGDSLTLALIFLGIAVTSKLIFVKHSDNQAKRLLIWVGVLAVLIGLTKQGFAPFSMLAFGALFIPRLKVHRKRILIILAAAIVGVMAWYGVVKAYDIESGQVLALKTIGIELRTPKEAVYRIVQNPLRLVRDVAHTFILAPQPGIQSNDIPNYIFTTFTGRFDTFFIAMPVWYAVMVILMLIISYYRVHKSDLILSEAVMTKRLLTINKLVVFAVGAGSFLITLVAMYLYATNRTANFINGFQGRYLLPVAALFAFIPHSQKRLMQFSKNNLALLFPLALCVLYAAMLFTIVYISYLLS